jgi:hypothetical protein
VGLGLAVARQIATACGGELRVHSCGGRGTRVTASLRRLRPACTPRPTAAQECPDSLAVPGVVQP